jgi:hypothetical protein
VGEHRRLHGEDVRAVAQARAEHRHAHPPQVRSRLHEPEAAEHDRQTQPGTPREHPRAHAGIEAPEGLGGDDDSERLDERRQTRAHRRLVQDELQEDRGEIEAAQKRAQAEADDDVGRAEQPVAQQPQAQQRVGPALGEPHEQRERGDPGHAGDEDLR